MIQSLHIRLSPCSIFQRMLSASKISSRYYCFYFQITCNFFRVSHGLYFTSLELCSSAVSLLSDPDNLACNAIAVIIIIWLNALINVDYFKLWDLSGSTVVFILYESHTRP